METWKELPEHDDYMVSSFGRIMRKDSGKIYNGIVDSRGYVRFDLSKNGKRFVVFAHRAVAKAFIKEVDGKDQVNHIDGNKTNNHVENLEWCTGKENTQHLFRVLGRKPLNCKPVICMETNTTYESACEAGRHVGAKGAEITRCCTGKRKTAHGLHWKYADVV